MSAALDVLMMVAVSLLQSTGADQDSLRMKTPRRADAPLQLAGTLFTDTSLTVLLLNVSGREVTQVVMGAVLEDEASVVPSVTRIGIPCVATVPPDGFLVLTEINVGFDTAAAYFRTHGIKKKGVVIGITDVRFADGPAWSYPLAARGQFDEQVDQDFKEKVQALMEKQFPGRDVSWAFPGPTREGKVSTCRN